MIDENWLKILYNNCVTDVRINGNELSVEKLIDINAIRSREDLIKPPKKQIGQLDHAR